MDSLDVTEIITQIIDTALDNFYKYETPDTTIKTSTVNGNLTPTVVLDVLFNEVDDYIGGQSDEIHVVASADVNEVEDSANTAIQTSNESCVDTPAITIETSTVNENLTTPVVLDVQFEEVKDSVGGQSDEIRVVAITERQLSDESYNDPSVVDDKGLVNVVDGCTGEINPVRCIVENETEKGFKFEDAQSDGDNQVQSNLKADLVEDIQTPASRTFNENFELCPPVVDDEDFVVEEEKVVKLEAGDTDEDYLTQSIVKADVAEDAKSSATQTDFDVKPNVVDDGKKDIQELAIVTTVEDCNLVKSVVEDGKFETAANAVEDEINVAHHVVQDLPDKAEDSQYTTIVTSDPSDEVNSDVKETEAPLDEASPYDFAGEMMHDTLESKGCEETTKSAENVTQSSNHDETNDIDTVNINPNNTLDIPETISETCEISLIDESSDIPSSTTEPPMRDDFYSTEYLRSKGFSVNVFFNKRHVMNLTVTGSDSNNCAVMCLGLPKEMVENEIIPIFEKAGTIYKLFMVQNSGMVKVTYTTDTEATNAIKTLNNYMVHGQPIKVRKYDSKVRLFVKPIPQYATKRELFDRFCSMTTGLVKVLLFNSYEDEKRNRGFCFLEYKDENAACDAKRCINGKVVFGQTLLCDWPENNTSANDPSLTLHISNLHKRIHAADLRKIFSVFGEIREIDKSGNVAAIRFKNLADSERAAHEVDKTMLGNENVEVSFDFTKIGRRSNLTKQIDHLKGPATTERFSPRATRKYGTTTEHYGPSVTRNYGVTTERFGTTTGRNFPTNTKRIGAANTTERHNPAPTQLHGSQRSNPATTKRMVPSSTRRNASTEQSGSRKDVTYMKPNENKFGANNTERSGPRKFMSMKDLSPEQQHGSHVKSTENL